MQETTPTTTTRSKVRDLGLFTCVHYAIVSEHVTKLLHIHIYVFRYSCIHEYLSIQHVYVRIQEASTLTVNVDIFACINFRGFMKMGNFVCIKISILCMIGSLG